MSFCSKCGGKVDGNESFCKSCGETVQKMTTGTNTYDPSMDKVGGGILALGIIGVVFAILLPIVTYPCSIVGLVLANNDIKSGKTTKTTGKTLNIVALVIAACNSILGALIGSGLL